MIYGYARVSTLGQSLRGHSLEEQKQAILDQYPGATVIEESMSGVKERPKFNKLLETCKEDDILVVTKLDRFCRSSQEGTACINQLLQKGVKIHILNLGLIENTPMGKLITTCLLAFSEFERELILERTSAGKAIAKQNPNFREGRPHKFTREQVDHALDLLDTHSLKQVERMTGISMSTLSRYKKLRKEQQWKEKNQ